MTARLAAVALAALAARFAALTASLLTAIRWLAGRAPGLGALRDRRRRAVQSPVGPGGWLGRAAIWLAGGSGSAVVLARSGLLALAAWAARRSLAPNSLIGVSLLLALCSAAWLSGGSAADMIRGAAALGAWYLALLAASGLARAGAGVAAGAPGAVAVPWRPGAVPGRVTGTREIGWLWALCVTAAECAVYGGIAASGGTSIGSGRWSLAVLAVVAVAVTGLARSCRGPARPGSARSVPARSGSAQFRPPRPAAPGPSGRWPAWLDRLAAPSAGFRVLLAMAGLAFGGPSVALLAVLAVAAVSACYIAVAACLPGRSAGLGWPAPRRVLLACRDDGPVARWAGRLVRGNLIPLPPALAGLVATALLALLGLRDLPGLIALTPPVVLSLAAPGSSHPHDGRSDWLVPVLLLAGQYAYLAPLGFALAVPGPVTFAACALIAVWYAGIAAAARTRTGSDASFPAATGPGWEVRNFAIGLAVILRIALFGYLGLAACLGLLTCRAVAIGYLGVREEDRR